MRRLSYPVQVVCREARLTDQLQVSFGNLNTFSGQEVIRISVFDFGDDFDLFRTDLAAEYHTKSDKKGEWVFAGLPFVGTYIVSVSAPGAQPNAKGNVKAGREIPVDVVLLPGDGKRLTLEEAKTALGSQDAGKGRSK